MGQTLVLHLSDELYAAIRRQAASEGTSPAQLAATSLQRQFGAAGEPAGDSPSRQSEIGLAREQFEQHFGEVDLGHPTGADNDAIDADLARQYAADHQGV